MWQHSTIWRAQNSFVAAPLNDRSLSIASWGCDMPQIAKLLSVLEEARGLLAAAENDFSWSSWQDRESALDAIDTLLSELRSGIVPSALTLHMLFAPTGPIQEVSLSSGWGDAFVELAERFDDAIASDNANTYESQQPAPREACLCFTAPSMRLISVKELGLDNHLAEISVLICQDCGQHWLRYFYEVEPCTGSGRWYLGAITPDQFTALTVERAKGTRENLSWYYYGGSYFQGRDDRSSGTIMLRP